jgi:hypothetical protein
MGLKNINAFEQHVEKIVLAVAAAGAVVMGYLATRTVGFPDPKTTDTVGPQDVEAVINRDIKALYKLMEDLEAEGKPNPTVVNYVDLYKKLSSDQPLDSTVLMARIPEFAPRNLRPGVVSEDPGNLGMECVIPDAPLAELVRAEALQLAVAPQAVGADGQPVAPQAGKQWLTESRNVVVIDGWVPVGQMVLQMLKVQDTPDKKKRFTADVQRGIVYRVHVQRRERLPGGVAYSIWEDVTPAKGAPAPAEILTTTLPEGDLPNRLPEIEAQFQWIQLPPFYVDAQGQPVQPPILSKPIPKAIAEETAKLRSDLDAARTNVTTPGVGRMVSTGPGAVSAETTLPTTMDALKALEVQPFTFWDETAKPDHTYQYQVRVELVNPGFTWKWGLAAAQKSLKLEPVLPVKDQWVAVGPVTVNSDLAFFISGQSYGGLGGIAGRIFKQENGRWFAASFTAQVGMNIAAPMNVAGQPVEVDTKFALVDCQQGGSNVHVILKDPAGNLVTRESSEDWKRPENEVLNNKAKEGAAAAAAAAATAPVDTTGGTAGSSGRGAATVPFLGRGSAGSPPATTPAATRVRVNP